MGGSLVGKDSVGLNVMMCGNGLYKLPSSDHRALG